MAAVLHRESGLSRPPMAVQDFAILWNRADATIPREVEGVLPAGSATEFPSRTATLRVPSSRYQRVDRAVAAGNFRLEALDFRLQAVG